MYTLIFRCIRVLTHSGAHAHTHTHTYIHTRTYSGVINRAEVSRDLHTHTTHDQSPNGLVAFSFSRSIWSAISRSVGLSRVGLDQTNPKID